MSSVNYGSKRIVTGAGYGFRDWLAQRVTGTLMALFTVILLAQVIFTAGPIGYEEWAGIFASQWMSYSPQAKSILFGNAGPHRRALDDIMTISERLKQVGQRFGNPSGTAQNANFAGLGAGLVAAPLTTLATAVGGAAAARILAAPAAASSAVKWSRAYAALSTRPSAHTLAAYQVASRNLINTAGIKEAATVDFLRAVQGGMSGRSEDENQKPERVINR